MEEEVASLFTIVRKAQKRKILFATTNARRAIMGSVLPVGKTAQAALKTQDPAARSPSPTAKKLAILFGTEVSVNPTTPKAAGDLGPCGIQCAFKATTKMVAVFASPIA